MAQLVLGVAGAVVGSAFGMPGIGWAIGSAIGGALAPTQKSYGPRLSDLKVTTVEYGSPIPLIEGHPRISGTVAWCSDKIEVENTTSQGKGGGAESTSYTYKVNILILLADNEILGIRRIWSTGKLVWSIADDSDEETIEASEETTSWDAMRVYTGAMDQLPDPVYEAAVGLGNAPAYRGRGYVFFEGLNLGSSGQLPNLTFEVNAEVEGSFGNTRLILEDFAKIDREFTPPHGAAQSTVKMTVVFGNKLRTYSAKGPTLIADMPASAAVSNPGRGNGDRAVMVFDILGSGTGADAGYVVAGDGIEHTVLLPSTFRTQALGGDSLRFSVFRDHIAVGSASPLADPGDPGNAGNVFVHEIGGAYIGYAATGAPVSSIALTHDTLYVHTSGATTARQFAITSGAFSEDVAIALPSGSGIMIFVGESGALYCATHEQDVYTYVEDGWLFLRHLEAEGVDLGTSNAIHFAKANGDLYAAVPASKTVVDESFYEYWYNTFYAVGEPWNRHLTAMGAARAQYYIHALSYYGPDFDAITNCTQFITAATPIDPPILSQSFEGSYNAYALEHVDIATRARVHNWRLDEWRDGSSSEIVYRVRQYTGTPRIFYAHDVYRSPYDLSGTLIDANLQKVVERLCYRAGLQPDDVDATALADDWVHAFAIPPGPAKAALDQLAAAYYFESYESDKLYFVKRGGDPVLTIPYRDLGADEQLQITDPNDLELPAQVYVTYQNLSDDYQQGSEQSDRLTTDSTAINNIQLALGFEPAQAKGIADTACLDQTIGARSLAFALDRRYAQLVPTDVVLLDDNFGNTFRARVIKVSDADGVRTVEAVADDASALNPTGTTSDNYTPRYTVRARALTDLLLLDMPILRDVDDTPSLYAVGDGLGGAWPGWALYINSVASGASPNGAQQGAAVDVLGDWAGHLVDECNSVTVQLNPSDQLTSITHDQLTSTILNYAVLGVHGRWEVIQFRSAQLVATGRYKLTGIIRGQLGTEQHRGSHQIGDRFVLLTGDGMLRPPGSVADILQPRAFLGVTIGARLDSATAQTFTLTGEGLRPYAPVNLRQAPQPSGDLVLTWDRRTRYQTNLLTGVVPLGESDEAYDIEIYSGATLKRTLTSATPTATYTAAQQVADFGATQAHVSTRIYQRSAIVGRGTPLIFEA